MSSRLTTITSDLRGPPEAVFDCRRSSRDGSVWIRLSGEVDVWANHRLEATLRGAHDAAGGALVVSDWTGLQLLSCACAQTLADADDRYRRHGGRAVVIHVPPAVDRYLRIIGLDHAFEVLDATQLPHDDADLRPTWSGPPTATVTLADAVTPATVTTTRTRIQAAFEHGHQHVVLELADLRVGSRQASIMLASALGRCTGRETLLTVRGAPAELRRILGLCAFAGIEVRDAEVPAVVR